MKLRILSLLVMGFSPAVFADKIAFESEWLVSAYGGANFDPTAFRFGFRWSHVVTHKMRLGFFFTSDPAGSTSTHTQSYGLRLAFRPIDAIWLGSDVGVAVSDPGSPRSGHGIVEPFIGYEVVATPFLSFSPEFVVRMHGDKSAQLCGQLAANYHF